MAGDLGRSIKVQKSHPMVETNSSFAFDGIEQLVIFSHIYLIKPFFFALCPLNLWTLHYILFIIIHIIILMYDIINEQDKINWFIKNKDEVAEVDFHMLYVDYLIQSQIISEKDLYINLLAAFHVRYFIHCSSSDIFLGYFFL